jgi:predicted DNA-binding transcriptional regulator AlpA
MDNIISTCNFLPEKQYFTTKELAKFLGFSKQRFWQWSKKKGFPKPYIVNKQTVLWHKEQVLTFFKLPKYKKRDKFSVNDISKILGVTYFTVLGYTQTDDFPPPHIIGKKSKRWTKTQLVDYFKEKKGQMVDYFDTLITKMEEVND